MADTVWVVRHGHREDTANPEWFKTAARPLDPGLSPEGIREAESVGQRLAKEGVKHVFASPFLRAVETAHHIAKPLGLHIRVETGLSEWLNADWFASAPEALPLTELAGRFPEVDLQYRSVVTPHYPEDAYEAFTRAGNAVQTLVATHREPILLVGHGASVAGAIFGLVPKAGDIHCSTCGLYKLVRQQDGWELQLRNDTLHLRKG
jgi:broad specificity phosphatase PhoE